MSRLFIMLIAALLSTGVQAGAFGSGAFENDDALDWVASCVRSSGTMQPSAAFEAALRPGYLEAPEASAAIAAAEVVAAALGKPSRALPKEMSAWLERQPKPALANLRPVALQVLLRVKDPKLSELRQLWSEGKSEQWLARIAELESRLGQ
jgi:hypothetical protein